MISDIIESQQNTSNNCMNDVSNSCNVTNDDISNNTNVPIPLLKDNHQNIYNFFVDEIKTYKQASYEKDQQINILNTKIEELVIQLNDLESKINKMNNINLLIKLKENLTNKQNDFTSEINNIEVHGNNTHDKSNDNVSTNLSFENTKTNIIIENVSEKSTKPIKRKNVFSRRF
jgi:hypothetical protein